MTIRARCPHCDHELAFAEAEEGKEHVCPSCRGGLQVPPLIYYACVTCQHTYRSSLHHAERTFPCRECQDPVTVPTRSTRSTRPERSSTAAQLGEQVDRDDFSSTTAPDADGRAESTSDDWFDEGAPPVGMPQFDADSFVTSTSTAPAQAVYAGFGRRLAAWGIDVVILAVVQFAGGVLLGFLGGVVSNSENTIQGLAMGGNFLGVLFTLLYFTTFEASYRQGTFGKVYLGLLVTDERGRRISYGRALVRYLGKILSTLACGIGYLMIIFTPNKQGLHDLIAGTYVEVGE